MKKFLLIATLALLFTTGSAYATPVKNEIPSTVQEHFKRHFAQATAITWESAATWYKASFQLNGQYLTAYFGTNGRPIAVSRNITTTQLPLNLQGHLQEYLQQYWVTDLFELATGPVSQYYITLENADETLILVNDGGQWTTYKRLNKG